MKKQAIFLGISLWGSSLLSFACPTPQEAVKLLQKTVTNPKVHIQFKVLKVKPVPQSDLCELVVKVNIPNVGPASTFPQIAYVTNNSKYFIYGTLLNLQNGENITSLESMKYRRIGKNRMQMLKKYTAFSYYKGKSYFNSIPKAEKYIYFITDPKCPFCHESEPMLQKWADKNDVEIRVVYDPLPIHPNSYQTAVGLYCHKKGWKSLEKAYNTPTYLSQCKEGETFIKESTKLAPKVGATGTPTFINQYGEVFIGMPPNTKYMDLWLKK